MSKEIDSTIKMPKSFWEVSYDWEEDEANNWSYIKGSLNFDIIEYKFTQKRKSLFGFRWYYKPTNNKFDWSRPTLEEGYFKGISSHDRYASTRKSAIAKAEKRFLLEMKQSEKESKSGDEYSVYSANLLKDVYPLIKTRFTKLKGTSKSTIKKQTEILKCEFCNNEIKYKHEKRVDKINGKKYVLCSLDCVTENRRKII